MKRDRPSQFWDSATQCFFGSIGVAVLAFVCFWLQVNLATASFAFLILIALFSLIGSFVGSVILSIAAAACLTYFFALPTLSLRTDVPQDVLALAAFLTTSIIITGLTAKVREMAERIRSSHNALVDTIPALVWTARPDGLRDFHSQRWLEFAGISASDAAGDGWTAVFHPEDRARTVDKWRLAVATGEPFEVEARGRSASGEYRWFLVRAQPLRDERGTIVKWYGSSTDIEDRKRAAEALRESEEQWKEVFEHNPVMYFMVDANGTVLSVNGFGAAQLGYTVGELVGQSVLNVFFEEDREFVRTNLAACSDNPGQSNGWEVRKICKDGTVLWVRENAKAVRRAGNQLIVLIACEDITERKRAEDALNLTRAELARVTRVTTMGELTAAIAHEVSQPLTGLVSSGNACLRWLGGDPPNLEAARRAVERMVNDGSRAGEVISRIRAMAKKSSPRKDKVSINDTIMEVLALIGGEVQRHNISLRTDLSHDLPLVLGDRIQLQQVLLNLIVNAMEAMSGVSPLQRELSVASTRNGSGVLVTVRDSGPGLDRVSADRLFEAFYTTKAAGMGMGLAISRTIIEAHRGRLWATPNLPQGAVFQFRLPTDDERDAMISDLAS
jgi:PAS domain S-box-containing protein